MGGFSTVYLYEQLRPRREVAIKVLTTAALTAEGRRRFEIESDLMAALSAHPYIVTIHDAAITDDGSPYLVMEYYPGANLGLRARSERIGLAEVLQVGIHIASAVESAHRIGIIHRDIKPANVLTSRYNRPGLSDFGVSTSASTGEHNEVALSIPWSPPEAFDPTLSLDFRADVYSLGAFIYSLLCGRAPFEIVGGDNTLEAVTDRILNADPQAIGREDVPAEMERLLMQAMARNPDLRPGSALALAQTLQAVELDLSLPPSQIDVMEEISPSAAALGSDSQAEPTQLRMVTLTPVTLAAVDLPAQPLDHTRLYEPVVDGETVAIDQHPRRKPLVLLAALGVGLLVLLAGMAIARAGGTDTEVTPSIPSTISTPTPTPVASEVAATMAPTPTTPAVSEPAANTNGNGKNDGKGPKDKPGKGPKGR